MEQILIGDGVQIFFLKIKNYEFSSPELEFRPPARNVKSKQARIYGRRKLGIPTQKKKIQN